MSDNKTPKETPELDDWILESARKRWEELSNVEIPDDLAEAVGQGRIVGPEKAEDLTLERSIEIDNAIEEAERLERLKKFKVIKND